MSELVLSMNERNPTTRRDGDRKVAKPRRHSFARGLLFAIPIAALLWVLLFWLL